MGVSNCHCAISALIVKVLALFKAPGVAPQLQPLHSAQTFFSESELREEACGNKCRWLRRWFNVKWDQPWGWCSSQKAHANWSIIHVSRMDTWILYGFITLKSWQMHEDAGVVRQHEAEVMSQVSGHFSGRSVTSTRCDKKHNKMCRACTEW